MTVLSSIARSQRIVQLSFPVGGLGLSLLFYQGSHAELPSEAIRDTPVHHDRLRKLGPESLLAADTLQKPVLACRYQPRCIFTVAFSNCHNGKLVSQEEILRPGPVLQNERRAEIVGSRVDL